MHSAGRCVLMVTLRVLTLFAFAWKSLQKTSKKDMNVVIYQWICQLPRAGTTTTIHFKKSQTVLQVARHTKRTDHFDDDKAGQGKRCIRDR